MWYITGQSVGRGKGPWVGSIDNGSVTKLRKRNRSKQTELLK
jgi:hypothetical protein